MEMDKLWDRLPDWVPNALSGLDSALAILLALAAIAARLPTKIWRRTQFARRRAQSNILDQLAIGRRLQTVESALGQPQLISRAYQRDGAPIEERFYRLPGAWVTVQAPDGVIAVYTITITDPKMYYDTGPATLAAISVRLGRDTFADAPTSPDETLEIYARLATFVRYYDFGSTAAGNQYLWLAFNFVGAGNFDGGIGSYATGRYAENHFDYQGDGRRVGAPPDYTAITVNTLTVADLYNHDQIVAARTSGSTPRRIAARIAPVPNFPERPGAIAPQIGCGSTTRRCSSTRRPNPSIAAASSAPAKQKM